MAMSLVKFTKLLSLGLLLFSLIQFVSQTDLFCLIFVCQIVLLKLSYFLYIHWSQISLFLLHLSFLFLFIQLLLLLFELFFHYLMFWLRFFILFQKLRELSFFLQSFLFSFMYLYNSLLNTSSSLLDLIIPFVNTLIKLCFLHLQSLQIFLEFFLPLHLLRLQLLKVSSNLGFFLWIIPMINHHFFRLTFVLRYHFSKIFLDSLSCQCNTRNNLTLTISLITLNRYVLLSFQLMMLTIILFCRSLL